MPRLTMEGPLPRDAIGAVLFLQAVNMTYQSFGTLNSSPWTIENVGADKAKSRSMYEYNAHAGGSALVMAGIGAYVAKSWWPIVGVAAVNGYLFWIYRRAHHRGRDAGSKGEGWFDEWGKDQEAA